MRASTFVLAMVAGLLLMFVGPILPLSFGMAIEHDTVIRYCGNHRGVQSLSVSRGFMQITDHGTVLCKDGTTEDYAGQTDTEIVFKPGYKAWGAAFDVAPLFGMLLVVIGFLGGVYAVRYGYGFA